MAYSTYTTEAIVCGSKASLTSDRSYLLFTREAGMLWATARSVREEKSKQRYALQDFSLIRVSLVKGKSGWRIGSVESIANPFMGAANRLGRTGTAYLVKLVRRYIHGEQALPEVFDDLSAALIHMEHIEDQVHSVSLQQVVTLRLLHVLGYVVPTAEITPLLHPAEFASALAAYLPTHEAIIDALTTRAAEVSHL